MPLSLSCRVFVLSLSLSLVMPLSIVLLTWAVGLPGPADIEPLLDATVIITVRKIVHGSQALCWEWRRQRQRQAHTTNTRQVRVRQRWHIHIQTRQNTRQEIHKDEEKRSLASPLPLKLWERIEATKQDRTRKKWNKDKKGTSPRLKKISYYWPISFWILFLAFYHQAQASPHTGHLCRNPPIFL